MKPNAIKAALVRKGISQRSLARKAKVSDSLISAVIKGLRTEGDVAKWAQWCIAEELGQPVAKVFP